MGRLEIDFDGLITPNPISWHSASSRQNKAKSLERYRYRPFENRDNSKQRAGDAESERHELGDGFQVSAQSGGRQCNRGSEEPKYAKKRDRK